MKVETLKVEQRPSYDTEYPNQLVGTVTLKGDLGQQTVKLSNGALSKIFAVIANEVQETARRNADAVVRGMQDAVDEPLLLGAQNISLDRPAIPMTDPF
jgi:hypothetical protein